MNILEARRRTLGKGVYKKTVEGNPAIALGSLARMYPGITMQGWTEQPQYEGKNLFNLVDLLSLIPESGSDIVNVVLNVTGLKPNTDYTLSSTIEGDVGGDYTNRCLYVGDTNVSNAVFVGHPVSKSSGDGGEITVYFYPFRDFSQDIKSGSGNVQLEEGAVATTYEPYTGGQPSPNPEYPQEIVSAGKYNEEAQKYEYQVKLTGKNLWNAEEAAETSKWVASKTQKGYSDFAIDVAPGQQITFSFPEKLPLGICMYVAIVSIEDGKVTKWLYHSTLENLIVQQVTITAITDKIWVRCNTGSIEGFVQDNPYFQIEYGSKRTAFQPYKEQTVTLTADRPLTKWDKLEKRNGQWGWAYKSAEIVLDGSKDEAWSFFGTDSFNQFYINIDTVEHLSDEKNAYCKKFRPAVIADRGAEKEIIYSDNGAIAVSTELATELDAWKTWIQSNPITVLYRSIEETFVPLSEPEQEQMNELYTFRPTTVLSNDCDCNMSLTYKTKKSLEVTT